MQRQAPLYNKHSWYVQYTYALIKAFLGPFVRLFFVKEVSGIENIPPRGQAVIVAFNHQSYFDFICFIAISPRHIHFVSAEKFFDSIFWSPLMKFTGQIKVQRNEHSKQELHLSIHEHLKNGKMIGIFPEGTRAPDPVEMLHAFTGVAKYAVIGEVPVIPVGIKGAHYVMSRHDKFPHLKKIISIHIGMPIHFTEHHGMNLTEHDYRSLTDRVMVEISNLSGKTYPHIGKVIRDSKPVIK